MKFFGKLAIMDSPQQVCETFPVFLNKVFEMALDADPVMIGVALDTLGLLGSTVEGKQVLQKTGQRMENKVFFLMCSLAPDAWLLTTVACNLGEKFKAVLSRVSQHANTGATELRVRSLDAISQLLTLKVRVSSPVLFFFLISSVSFQKVKGDECLCFSARASDRGPSGSDRVLVPPFVQRAHGHDP